MSLKDRVKDTRKALGLSQDQLAKDVGMSQAALSDIERGTAKASTYLIAIAKRLKVNADWLETGAGEKDPIRSEILRHMSPVITTEDMSMEERERKIWIDLYDVKFSCGTGESIDLHFESIKKSLSFEESFFQKRKIKPENFRLIYATGDSNEEYIFHGDAVGVDISDIEVKDGETYAIYFEGEAMIKQIFKEAGGNLTLHSRNPKYRDRTVSATNGESFMIIGRVKYRSG